MTKLKCLLSHNFELLFWLSAMVFLYLNPVGESHFTCCPIGALGFSWCPGCGLGHSIHHYLHLDFAHGWEAHYLGAVAIPLIMYRMYQLFNINHIKTIKHEKQNF